MPRQEPNTTPNFPTPTEDSNPARKIKSTRGGGAHGPPLLSRSRFEGPWYRETQASPHHGNRPQNAIASNGKTRDLGPRKGLFRNSGPPWFREQSGTTRQTSDDIQHTIQYRKQEAQARRHPPDTETRKGGFQRAPRGGGRTPSASLATTGFFDVP